MKQILEAILGLPFLKGRRTQAIQGLFMLYAVYNSALAAGFIKTDVISPEWQTALFSLFAAAGLKFAKEHREE